MTRYEAVGFTAGGAGEGAGMTPLETELLAALNEISKGAGEFSMDPLEHATNCIESMREIARTALTAATGEQT